MSALADGVYLEVRHAAKDLARKGLHGNVGDPLPNLMSSAACEWINANQKAFAGMVSTERVIERVRRTQPSKTDWAN
jgi:hypothetical protein